MHLTFGIMQRLAACTVMAMLLMLACQRSSEKNTLATVGEHRISVDEFIEDYELSPRPGIVSRTSETRRIHLDKMIENYLLAEYGLQHHYDSDPRIINQIRAVSKTILVQQLYRTRVAQNAAVTEADLRDAFLKSRAKIRARHLFVKTRQQADSLLKLLHQGATFQQLSKDLFRDSTLARNGGDIGYFSFGDMDEAFEEAAYQLAVGEISRPVATKWGFHLIQVEDRISSPIVTENEFQQRRQSLERIVVKRKQEALARDYVKEFMTPKQVVAKAEAINFLVRAARRIKKATDSRLPSELPLISDEEVRSVQHEIENHSQDVLVEFEGGSWTIQQFFEKMAETLPQDRPDLASHLSFAEELAVMVRNDFLAEEARRLGLEEQPWAAGQLAQEKAKLLANLVRLDLVESIRISDDELVSQYHQFAEKYSSPAKYRIKEIVVAGLDEAQKIYQKLLTGADFSSLVQQHSIREQSARNGGELGAISRIENPDLVHHIEKVNVGQFTAPIAFGGQYRIFQLVEKVLPQRIAFEHVQSQVRQDIWNDKIRVATDGIVQPMREKFPIWINEKLLRSLELSGDKNVEMIGFPK
ncbi:MAG: peptidylprolyl isomerase [Candidatus Zhuqueibacterota bacterium]